MNAQKRCSIGFIVLMLILSASIGHTQVKTILDVYSELPGLVGETITVEGFYYGPDYPMLGIDRKMFEISVQPSPHSMIKLTGSIPEARSSFVEVTGVIDTVSRTSPHLGVSYMGRLTVESVKLKKATGQLGKSQTNLLNELKESMIPNPDECTFAMLISSDHERPDFWGDMATFWFYVTEWLGLPPENIWAFYGDGTSRDEIMVPSEKLRPADKESIRQAYDEIKQRIIQCETSGKKTKLIKLVTDHGSGYHTGSSNPDGPQGWSDGWQGGHIDRNGDESDRIRESQLKFDCTKGPAPGKEFHYDLDGDGNTDIIITNDPEAGLIASVPFGENDEFRIPVGADTNGDKIIDENDGGIDLNADGDMNDSYAWDEDLCLSMTNETILDDEWAEWQKELSDACLDSIFELIDCCFSGGFINDMQREIPCKTAVRMGTASEEGEYSYGCLDEQISYYIYEWMMGMLEGWVCWDTIENAGGEMTYQHQTPKSFKKDGTGDPANSGKAPYRYKEDYGNPPRNGWRYYANEGELMREMEYDKAKKRYYDPRYGGAYNDRGLIVPDEENGVNVKIALHPNVNKDLRGKDSRRFKYRVNAKALPKGASLRIWIANSAADGFKPNPLDVVKEIMPNEYFDGGDIISREWPVILNVDIKHCQWIIAEVDPGAAAGPKPPGWGPVPQPPDTIIFPPPPGGEGVPDTIIIPPPPWDGDIFQFDPWADFGDAPDNTLTPMLAGYDQPYETVLGQFPTLFATDNGSNNAPGNHHWNPYYIGLGPDVSVEEDAWAPLADEDPLPNIDPFLDIANQDSICDGLLTDSMTVDSKERLKIIVKALAETEAYLNVLCDWNHDGKWGGAEDKNGTQNGAREWAVQNQKLQLKPVLNAIWSDEFPTGHWTSPCWVRINLSLEKVNEADWDGSGEFEYGEVEDYLIDMKYNSGVAPDLGELIIPKTFSLSNNYPNPFNPETQIRYDLATQGQVRLVIYNILGTPVRILVDKKQNAGSYDIFWDGLDMQKTRLPSGAYFYQLQVQSQGKTVFKATKKLLMLQ